MKKQIKKQKRNRKLLLLAALATFGVVGGTFGGTYAWFVAQRSAQATIGNISAATSGNLSMRWGEGDWGTSASVASATLTDISGDGRTLYRPQISPASNTGSVSFSGIINAADTMYYSQVVQFRAEKALNVYVGASSVTSNTTTDGDLSGALRLAFITGDTVIQILHDGGDASYNYISGTAIDAAGAATATTAISTQQYKDMSSLTVRNTTDGQSATLSETIATTSTVESPVSVTVVMWLEGVDSHCVNDNRADTLDVELNFYAIDPTENIA